MGVQDLLASDRILYLSRNDLLAAGLLDYAAVVEDVRRGISLHTQGETLCDKLALDFDVDRDWKASALVGAVGSYVGLKWLGANTDNRSLGFPRSSSLIVLNDQVSGRALCIMDGSLISALRTGACAALAAGALGSPEPTCVGFLGAGVISRCALLCMAAVLRDRIGRVLVHDLFPESQDRFARLMGAVTGLLVEPAGDLGAMVRQSGITVSATTAMAPLIKLSDVRPASTHIHLGGWEDEEAYVLECAQAPNKIVCDDLEMVIHRNTQTVAYAFNKELIGREHYYGDLGEILLATKPGREGDELIYFNAVGLPVLDVIVATRLFEKALAKNKGLLLGSQAPHWILTGDPAL